MRMRTVGGGRLFNTVVVLALVGLAAGCDGSSGSEGGKAGGGGVANRQTAGSADLTPLSFHTSVKATAVLPDNGRVYIVSNVKVVPAASTTTLVDAMCLSGPTPALTPVGAINHPRASQHALTLTGSASQPSDDAPPAEYTLQIPVSATDAASDMSGPVAHAGVLLVHGGFVPQGMQQWILPSWPVTARTRVVVATAVGAREVAAGNATFAAEARPDGSVLLMLLEAGTNSSLQVNGGTWTLQPGEYLLLPPEVDGQVDPAKVSENERLHPLVKELRRLGEAAGMVFNDTNWLEDDTVDTPNPAEPPTPSGS
jgi:hypothetical protein